MRQGKHQPQECMLCEVPSDLQRLEQRMILAERDITVAAVAIRETEARWLEHMRQFSAEVARLSDCVGAIARLVTASGHNPGSEH